MAPKRWIVLGLVCSMAASAAAQATAQPLGATASRVGARLKDIAVIQGVRSNPLIGYGVVTGLNGTGDSTQISRQLLSNLLERLHLTASERALNSKNIAAVMVSATLPPFSKEGSTIDVVVSSLGDAKSLAGGVLEMAPLYGANQQVYAVARGPLSVGGYFFAGAAGQTQKNHPVVGRIPNGATVEMETRTKVLRQGCLTVTLREPDFTTAQRLADAINSTQPGSACAMDAASVRIKVPEEFQADDSIVRFIAQLEDTEVVTDSVARVVINERTGTIVAGANVRIDQVAVAHGNLTLTISESPQVSQPTPFSTGQTVVTPQTQIVAREKPGSLFVLEGGVSVDTVARALNTLGVTPRDMICIFQALKLAGALHAELIIM